MGDTTARQSKWSSGRWTVAVLLLTGCGSPDEGDRVACEAFGNAHNVMLISIYGESEREARSMTAAIPGAIDDALLVVEDPELKIGLSNARQMHDGLAGGDEDMGTAYFLYASEIFTTCQDLGVDVEKVTDTDAETP